MSHDSALRRIMKLHSEERESPEKRSDVASLKKLLNCTGVGHTTTSGGLARFDSGVLSVPIDQTEALGPAPWMAQELRHFLADPVGEMMLDETERGRLLDAVDQPGVYHDPSLQDIGTYARFLVAKLIRFGVPAKSVCGVFCAAKKTPGR